ncbi:hypothetical protein RN001_006055 [Aquatica leii]|uniref:Peptidyl-prolyl cis-trans isomerase n=1 Tax=Aquatica leii TaxID=1421715 RepID=A0AAN7SB09_9COLE|nr:hypothetical protein RN001_006055 [Aquatica leii]
MNIYFYICLLLAHISISSCSGSSESDMPKVNKKAFLDIKAGDNTLGRIEVGLFGKIVPKTVQNFYELCQLPQKGYKGTRFFQVLKDFIIMGGDITKNNGHGGYSIYGDTFEDENYKLKHYGAGWISLANWGKNMNKSIFCILLKPAPWLDEKYVVFAKVLKGMEVIKKIENVEISHGNAPLIDVIIDNCTVEEVDNPFSVSIENAE